MFKLIVYLFCTTLYASALYASNLNLNKIFDLKNPKTQKVTSGGSGIIHSGKFSYFISDNSTSIIQLKDLKIESFKEFPIFNKGMPNNQIERKKVKPDLESVVLIPKSSARNKEHLLLVPSGSERNRQTGALLKLFENGDIDGSPLIINFSNLYTALRKKIINLNIEGSAIINDHLYLFHRANSLNSKTAIIKIDIHQFFKKDSFKLSKKSILAVKEIYLGKIENVVYSFTDAIQFEGSIYFLASAENTKDTYLDGAVLGSIIGKLDPLSAKTYWIKTFDKKIKLEGLAVAKTISPKKVQFHILSDLDDDNIAAELYLTDPIDL